MNQELLRQELNVFNYLRNELKKRDDVVIEDLEEYSFVIKKKHGPVGSGVGVLFCALTHGNEVIGLQIVNLILNSIVKRLLRIQDNIAFMLNNVSAYEINKRFCDQDLNRSFMSEDNSQSNYEVNRAKEIQNMILTLKPNVIVDLHQTIEPTHSSFFVIPENDDLVSLCYHVNYLWPILCFDSQGFSSDGRTLLEFAFHHHIKCFVIEVSQNGFDQIKAIEVALLLQEKFIVNSVEFITSKVKSPKAYYLIKQKLVKNRQDNDRYKMKRKFINLDKIEKGECVAESNSGDKIVSSYKGVILFPKSDERIDDYQDVGLIAQLVEKA